MTFDNPNSLLPICPFVPEHCTTTISYTPGSRQLVELQQGYSGHPSPMQRHVAYHAQYPSILPHEIANYQQSPQRRFLTPPPGLRQLLTPPPGLRQPLTPPPGLDYPNYNPFHQSNHFPEQPITPYTPGYTNYSSPTPRGRGRGGSHRGKKLGRGKGGRHNQRSSGVQEQALGTVTGTAREVHFYGSLKVGRQPLVAATCGMDHVSDRHDLHGVPVFPVEKSLPERARCLCMECSQ